MTPELAKRYNEAKRALFRQYYGARLNPEQTDAVLTAKGPLLILAGAGSGKTTVLVNRICHIIKYGDGAETSFIPSHMGEADVEALEMAVNCGLSAEDIETMLPAFIHNPCAPWAMLAITFTNKAAREIKERLAAALGDGDVSEDIWAGTFHAVCVRMLRKFGDRVGLPGGFSIYDTADKKHLISDVMKALNIDEKILPIRSVMSAISEEKDNLRLPKEMKVGSDLRSKHIHRIYESYQAALEKYGALDFDDIIMKTVKMLEDHEDIREYYQNKFSYVCVDEYQDTNPAQFRLTELLSAKNRNIMVVGDDDQSIYKFRGATIENILQFDTVYPDAKVIKLEQNYRSTKTILAAANAVIAHNEGRRDKALWCAAEEGEKITVHAVSEGNAESGYIIDTILKMVVNDKKRYSDFAILYRVNEISRGLETAFAKSGLPYRLLGGMRFYDRKEIKDIMAYLLLILNPADDVHLRRAIGVPKRGIGEKTLDTVAALAAEEGLSMFAVMERAEAYPAIARSADKLKEFAALIRSFQSDILRPSALLPLVMEKSGYLTMLRALGEEGKADIDNLNELVSAAVEYEGKTEEPTLAGFLEEAALVADVDKYDEEADAVVMMTIHSAKGLEFPVVFIAGAEEGIFPGMQSIREPAEMSEERRLAYVAITRAKEKLFVTHAAERLLYGTTQYRRLSRFFDSELPASLKEAGKSVAPPPKQNAFYRPKAETLSGEFERAASVSAAPVFAKKTAPLLAAGDRVKHITFGEGEILSVRPMGADALYEVRFSDGNVKKLMATYAKLQKL